MKAISEENNPVINYNICLKDKVKTFTKKLFYAIFDESYYNDNIKSIKKLFFKIAKQVDLKNADDVWSSYKAQFKEIRLELDLDALAAEKNDPATKSLAEVYLAYPGFHAIAIYRLSNALLKLDAFLISRIMSEYVHGVTGIEIHPGATIGKSFFIDHGTGIVIGETAIIKDHVKIYQGVTLGGISVKKSLASTKRHPTIEENVTIYANATILGGDIVIGANSVIGANVWITQSVPENSLVTYQSEIKIRPRR